MKTAETIWQARRKVRTSSSCLPTTTSTGITPNWPGEVYTRYTDLVEPFGIDESWLDVTGTLHLFGGDPVALANQLRDVMKQELGLTISVGVSFNKVFAKLGSDYKSPMPPQSSGGRTCPGSSGPAGDRSALCGQGLCPGAGEGGHPHHWRLGRGPRRPGGAAVGKTWGADPRLRHRGRTAAQSARREVPPPKSVGNGLTFRRNLVGEEELRAGVYLLAERVAPAAAAASDEVHHRAGGPAQPRV